jgi:hypothetical protein
VQNDLLEGRWLLQQISPLILMENGPNFRQNVFSTHLEPVAVPNLALPNAVPNLLLPTAPQYQSSPAALEFLQPSTSGDFKYEHLFHFIHCIS